MWFTLREIAVWLVRRRNLWLVPLVAVVLFAGAVLAVGTLGPLGTFLYPFF